MMNLSRLFGRLRATVRPERVHGEISEELRFHLEMKIADLVRSGLSPAEARKRAAQSFGPFGRIWEQGYDVRGGGAVEQAWGDLRLGWRNLCRQPLKTAILIATLALGVGVNSAVFGVVKSVLLQPLPFRDPSELVVVQQAHRSEAVGVSYPNFLDWRAANHSFREAAVYVATTATLTGRGDAAVVPGAIVSASLFRLLDVHPLLGRTFDDTDDKSGATSGIPPVLISDRLWKSRFGGSANVLARQLQLDGRTYRIAGVIPSVLAFPIRNERVDYWLTVAVDADPHVYGGSVPVSRGYPRYDGVVARLKRGVTVAEARGDMATVARNIQRDHPKATSANDVAVTPLLDEVVGPAGRTMILILYGSACCLFLVACINVGNILLVDALARRREYSVRIALGAPAWRLAGQPLAESFCIAIAGAALGVLLARSALRLFVVFAPAETPRLGEIGLTNGVFVYALTLALGSGVLFGCVPAFSAWRKQVNSFLKEGSRTAAKKSPLIAPRSILICVQVLVAMVLTCSALILVNSFRQIIDSGRGFNPHGVLTASVSLPVASYGQGSPRVVSYYRDLLQSLRSLPGVQEASLSEVLPLSGQGNGTSLKVTGLSEIGSPNVALRFVEASYFCTLQIRLLSGRFFDSSDDSSHPPSAIVNAAFVRRFLAGDPYRRTIELGWGGSAPKQIVGVLADVRPSAASATVAPEVYVPFAQFPSNDMSLLVRVSGDPYLIASSMREAVKRLDPSIPLDRVRTLDDYLLLGSAQQRFLMYLFLSFAAATILLSALGMYGVLSDAVLSREREFGIRLAIGSSKRRVIGLVLSHGMTVTITGLVLGSIAAVFVAHVLSQWIYQPDDSNAKAYWTAGGILFAAAITACWIPSRRAAACDPVSLLRSE